MWKLMLNDINSPDLFKNIIKTDWLSQVENILLQAQKAAKLIFNGESNVLVYCASGTVGSSVISSLIQIFCDPSYRTFKGFKTLFLKEWTYY